MKPFRTTCILALALAALGIETAQAVTMTEYDVTVEGRATYDRADSHESPLGPWVPRNKAEFAWKTRFPSVTFIGKQVSIASRLPETTVSGIKAEMSTTVPTLEGPKTRGVHRNHALGPGRHRFASVDAMARAAP